MATQSGVLGQVQIMDVLRPINAHKKTGIMRMVSKDARTSGLLYIHLGEIVHAVCGNLTGEDAAYELLALSLEVGGTFSFKSPEASASLQPKSIHRSWEDLILQAGKVVDTKRRVYAKFPDLKVVPYYVDPTTRAKGVKLHDEDKTVADAIDGVSDFTEITATTGIDELSVLQTACVLQDAGAIQTISPLASGIVQRRKKFLMKPKDVLIPGKLESFWKGMAPYARKPIAKIQLITSSGVRHEITNVRFDAKLTNEFLFPEESLAILGLAPGETLWIKPL